MSVLLEMQMHTSAQLLEAPAGSFLGTEGMGVCLDTESMEFACSMKNFSQPPAREWERLHTWRQRSS